MNLQDRFYKSTEVAEILGVSLRTLYRYMDSGKIGSVQLPSGRHRFTKKQVEEFLYSAGTPSIQNTSNNINVDYNSSPVQFDSSSRTDSAQYNISPVNTVPVEPRTHAVVPEPVRSYEKVEVEDDLEKELEALLESLDDDNNDNDDIVNSVVNDDIVKEVSKYNNIEVNAKDASDLNPFSSNSASSILATEPEKSFVSHTVNENDVNYFYCPYNELRTIARIIKKTADDESKKYAFTMNAGLSLFFPLDPFSIIHFYVDSNELEFWKRNLQLKESSQNDANIGVLLTQGNAFANTQEVSGLKVVSKDILLQNLRHNGKSQLADKADRELR